MTISFSSRYVVSTQSNGSIVFPPHRGGYCFELNTLFAAALKALGFKEVTYLLCRVRVNREKDDHTPYTHLALAVTIESTRYLCDVGFAGTQSIAPVLLDRNGEPQILPEGRFRTISQAGGYTMLERERNGQWDALYKFRKDEPALPCDIEVIYGGVKRYRNMSNGDKQTEV